MATVYIGVVSADTESAWCRDSIESIRRRPGDERPIFVRGTKGFEARQTHINNFKQSNHGAILLLDGDMKFEPDTLERLRNHGLPYVSGYYLRRLTNPIVPVWFYNSNGEWPLHPWLDEPERGKLHELGGSGWGCAYLTREVIDATAPILKGEPEILEDDMDLWPYDLVKVSAALNTLRKEMGKKKQNIRNYRKAAQVLLEELVILRGQKDHIGSDLRFPFYAKAAGYQLMGDPDVRPGHEVMYPLSPDDYTIGGQSQVDALTGIKSDVNKERERIDKDLAKLLEAVL